MDKRAMELVFAYCRVSTEGQTTENLVLELRAAGFDMDDRRIVRGDSIWF